MYLLIYFPSFSLLQSPAKCIVFVWEINILLTSSPALSCLVVFSPNSVLSRQAHRIIFVHAKSLFLCYNGLLLFLCVALCLNSEFNRRFEIVFCDIVFFCISIFIPLKIILFCLLRLKFTLFIIIIVIWYSYYFYERKSQRFS